MREFIFIVVECVCVVCLDVEFGICGEYGGDLKFLVIIDVLDLDYVLCLSSRVFVARFVVA